MVESNAASCSLCIQELSPSIRRYSSASNSFVRYLEAFALLPELIPTTNNFLGRTTVESFAVSCCGGKSWKFLIALQNTSSETTSFQRPVFRTDSCFEMRLTANSSRGVPLSCISRELYIGPKTRSGSFVMSSCTIP